MAKTNRTKLEEAKEELSKAQKGYDKLVRHDIAVLNDEQRAKHNQACREALDAKRKAAEVVEALVFGKSVPEVKEKSEANDQSAVNGK